MVLLFAERLLHQRLRGGLQGVHLPTSQEAADYLWPYVEARQARVSAPILTPPESLAGSPGLFESPSEVVVGQSALRLPYSLGPSTWEVGVEVDIFWKQGLK